jgi:hypothetical protein
MMELFEMESRGAFTPVKNTKGGTVDTIIDTLISFIFGDLIGPGIVAFFKKMGHGPIDKSSLPENGKLVGNLAVGSAGFYAAEESIGKFLDPQWKKLLPKMRQFMDDKIPDALIKMNQAGDKLIIQCLAYLVKKLKRMTAKTLLIKILKSESLIILRIKQKLIIKLMKGTSRN